MVRPKRDSKSKSFALYEKTWLMLKELEYLRLINHKKQISLKEIAHEAIEEYVEKEKHRLKNGVGIRGLK